MNSYFDVELYTGCDLFDDACPCALIDLNIDKEIFTESKEPDEEQNNWQNYNNRRKKNLII